ncbi:MAG TPA: hemolysin family protein [Candidatus Nanopelagicales bacterium]|nr:hemolysin family protein [Candidatus Nanopelagicales bacterium]
MTTSDWWLLLAAAVLVGLAGLLVAAEAAIGRVSRSRAEEMAREGLRGSPALLVVLTDRARYVNVLLFCHQTAMIAGIALVTVVALDVVPGERWWRVVAAVLVMAVVTYIALGVAPRTLGVQRADQIGRRAAGLARLLAAVLGPVTSGMILIGNAVTPGRGYREGPFASQAELREMVDLAEASSLIEDDERQMIHSVFELGDTIAREVMVPRTEMVYIERLKTLRQAMSLALRSGCSRIPVIGENIDDVVGVIYLKDLARRLYEHREAEQNERVEDLMRPAYHVPETKRADDLLRDMQSARVHLAIVIDEYGGTGGLVTIEDVVEEIVGEITDEYDDEVAEIEPLAHGAFRVSSRLDVDDLAELLDVELDGDSEGVDTVAGLMARRLGRVPVPDATIEVEGWQLVAEAGTGRRKGIGTVLARPPVGGRADRSEDDQEHG